MHAMDRKENKMPYCEVLLMNDDRSLCLTIGFFGYGYSAIEKYMTEKFIECGKEYSKKWTQMKYVNAVGMEA